MKRRDFLRNTALTGAGLMSGCMRNQPSGVIFKGWPYEPNLVQEKILTSWSGQTTSERREP